MLFGKRRQGPGLHGFTSNSFWSSFTIPARKSVTLFHRCLRAREYIGSTYNTIIFYTILCKYVRPQKMATAARAALPGHNSMALIFITASYQPYPTPSSTPLDGKDAAHFFLSPDHRAQCNEYLDKPPLTPHPQLTLNGRLFLCYAPFHDAQT